MTISIYKTYKDILQNELSDSDKKQKLNRLFQVILDEALIQENIHFTSLFSKLAFLGVRYELNGKLLYELHQLRKRIEKPEQNQLEQDIQLLSYIIPTLWKEINNENTPDNIKDLIPTNSGVEHKNPTIEKYIPNTKMVCTQIDKDQRILKGFLDEYPEKEHVVAYHIPDRNERFTSSLEQIPSNRLPIIIELLEVERTMEGIFRPSSFVIEPDFLFDVTAIASCFSHDGYDTVSYIYKKFLPMSWSKPLLLGNVANFFLDKLVNDSTLEFGEVVKEVFQLDPLAFARIEDHEMSSLLEDMKKHFAHIKQSIHIEIPKENINLKHSYLEPSFVSAQYGIQGRLDLLHMDEEYTSIVELKSGSIFKPNVYGLKTDHYVQTLLYDLMIRSTFAYKKPRNYILYSKEGKKSLRIAPRVAAQQKEALKVRNELLELELLLGGPEKVEGLFDTISLNLHTGAKGFHQTNISVFENRYSNLKRDEKDYFNGFVNFIALEHRLSKIGEYGQDKSNGLAGLWLDSHEEKCEQFNMINALEIAKNQSKESKPTITLQYSKETNRLSNFRAGDIVIFYPLVAGNNSPLRNQVFKCTIIEMSGEQIKIKLRSQQKNQQIFNQNKRWALEHDIMDSSFTGMYRQLFEWAGADPTKRDLLLGKTAPRSYKENQNIKIDLLQDQYKALTTEQKSILSQMIASPDYYLVWGPPGTGKTSRIISQYIRYMMEETDENLYVIAYTNRAVDELCEAIHSLGRNFEEMYVRIGSSFGTHQRYSDKLLQSKIKEVTHRKDLKKKLKSHRIVVGTLASIITKDIIFELIPSNRVIIDEASQILEPNIVGLLTRFEQFTLVGDHLQLPAVVVQTELDSSVDNPALETLGLVNRRDSFFERMYKRCLNKGWGHAVGQLQYQGRMHEDIMRFPNEQFYQESLKTMKGLDRLTHVLEVENKEHFFNYKRMLFQHVDVPISERFNKTNSAEVHATVNAVKRFQNLGYPLEEIGIITPFRAQIAAIKDGLHAENNDYIALMVDTVERYQGSAKQVIIISFCCNSAIQFRNMISMSTDGIDRKLNVALTRARERVLLIGDQSILGQNILYQQLLDFCIKI